MKNRESGLPFDDFRSLIGNLPDYDIVAAQHTVDQVKDRFGSTPGHLGDLCTWYSGWSGRSPSFSRPVATLFAGTHAVDASGDDELLARISEISSGNDAVNRLCQQNGLGLKVLDLALQIPVSDITTEAALDEKSCAGTIAFGMEAIAGGTDLLCISAVEHGMNVSNLAILSAVSGIEPERLLSGENRITDLAATAVSLASGHAGDAFEVLRRLGGRETAALCGAILAARTQHVPVIIAGSTAIAAAVLLGSFGGHVISHCRIAQRTGNTVMDELISGLGVLPIMNENLTSDPVLQLPIAAGLMSSACLIFGR